MAVVELTLTPLPAHVRTARLVVVAAARRAGLESELIDELRLAIGEAASRAVGLHRAHAPAAPVQISVMDDPAGLTVTVVDQGPQAGPLSDDVAGDLLGLEGADETGGVVAPDVALAVLSGLVDDCQIDATPGGTTVRLRWPLPARPLGAPGPGATQSSQV